MEKTLKAKSLLFVLFCFKLTRIKGKQFWLLMVLKETTVSEKVKLVSQRDIKETHIIMLFNLLLRLLLYGNA